MRGGSRRAPLERGLSKVHFYKKGGLHYRARNARLHRDANTWRKLMLRFDIICRSLLCLTWKTGVKEVKNSRKQAKSAKNGRKDEKRGRKQHVWYLTVPYLPRVFGRYRKSLYAPDQHAKKCGFRYKWQNPPHPPLIAHTLISDVACTLYTKLE